MVCRTQRSKPAPIVTLSILLTVEFLLMSPAYGQGAAAPAPPTNIAIEVYPEVVPLTGGKLPATMPLAVVEKDCDRIKIDISNYHIQLTGVGLSVAKDTIKSAPCSIAATLNIDPSAPPAKNLVMLTDANGITRGYTEIAVPDLSAAPIPPGLAPQVDVLWQVLSQDVCEDVFGKRVARNFYCIEIKLGNNSGHPLQIAGIGFASHIGGLPTDQVIKMANTSYASTRAVLLRESVLSARNEFYHTIQAAGLLMSAFTPFFRAPTAGKNFATAASIVSGPLLQAINVIGPDRVVGQLNNLDDESFRDNQVIPNNSHMRTMVFMEKSALKEILGSYCDDAVNAARSGGAGATDNGEDKKNGLGPESAKPQTPPAKLGGAGVNANAWAVPPCNQVARRASTTRLDAFKSKLGDAAPDAEKNAKQEHRH
jgi:hypothetical protein